MNLSDITYVIGVIVVSPISVGLWVVCAMLWFTEERNASTKSFCLRIMQYSFALIGLWCGLAAMDVAGVY